MADRNWSVTRIPSIFDSDDDSDEEISKSSPDHTQSKESTVFTEKVQSDSETTEDEDTIRKDHEEDSKQADEGKVGLEESFVDDEMVSKTVNTDQQDAPAYIDRLETMEVDSKEHDAKDFTYTESTDNDNISEQVTFTVDTQSNRPDSDDRSNRPDSDDRSNRPDSDDRSSCPEEPEEKDKVDDDLDKSFSSFDNVEEGSESDEADRANQSTSSHENVEESSEDTGTGVDKSFSSHDNAEEASEEEDMEVDKNTLTHENVNKVIEEGTGIGTEKCLSDDVIAVKIDEVRKSEDCLEEESTPVGIDKSGSSHYGTDEDATAVGLDKSGSSHDGTDEEGTAVRIDKSGSSHDGTDEEATAVGIDKSYSSHDNTDEASEEGADIEADKSISSLGNIDEMSDGDDGDTVLDKSISSHDNVDGSDDNEDKNDSATGDNELDISLSSQGNADDQSDGEANDSHSGFESEGERSEKQNLDGEIQNVSSPPVSTREREDVSKFVDSSIKDKEKEQLVVDGHVSPLHSKTEPVKQAISDTFDEGDHSAGSYEKVEEEKTGSIKSEIDMQIDNKSPFKDEDSGSEGEEKMDVDTKPEEFDKEDIVVKDTMEIHDKEEIVGKDTMEMYDKEDTVAKDTIEANEKEDNVAQDTLETREKEDNVAKDNMETGDQAMDSQGVSEINKINEPEPEDRQEYQKSLEKEKEKKLMEINEGENKQPPDSSKWDISADSEFESRDYDTQETMREKKKSESIYTDSETEDTMDIDIESEPKRSVASSGVARVPVRVEDVYTDSEDECTRDSQLPVGLKGCETSVTSETDSVDPEEQKDSLSIPTSPHTSMPGASGDIPQLATIEALPPSDIKDMPTTKLPESPEKKTHKRRHVSKKSVNLEACLKAFKQGWKREIVFRATVDPNKGATRADIYYYAPFGKKFRSKVEIEDYLQRYGIQDLTLDNFTWLKVPLGVSEEYEQIRHAAKSAGGSARAKSSTPSQTGTTTPLVTPVSSPKTPASGEVKVPRKRGRPPKQPSENPTKRARMKITPIIPLNLKKQLDNKKNVTPVPTVTASKTSANTSQEVSPTDWNSGPTSPGTSQAGGSVPGKGSTSSKSRENHIAYSTKVCESLISPKILTPMLSGDATLKTYHCTNVCPLGAGTVPSLQCIKCLCLFHPECTFMPPAAANIVQTGNAKFLCPNCYRENKENVGANQWIPPKPYEPLAYDPPSWESEDEEDNKPDKEVVIQNYVRVSFKDSLWAPQSARRVGVNDNRQSHSADRGTAVSLYTTESSVQTQSSVFTSDSQALANGLPASVSGVIGGLPPNLPNGQLVQIQSPGSVPTRFLLVRTNMGGEMQTVPQASQIGIPRGVYLPTNFIPGQPMPYMVSGSSQVRHPVPQMIHPGYQGTDHGTFASWQVGRPSFLRDLSQSYRLLLRVFKYLSVKDLLVASRVCVMWRDLAYSSSLWSTVRLRNVCVGDWSQFAKFLERRNTSHIDLRKMIFRHLHAPTRIESTLHQQEVSKIVTRDITSPSSKSSHASSSPDKIGSKIGSAGSNQLEEKSQADNLADNKGGSKALQNVKDHKVGESLEDSCPVKSETPGDGHLESATNEKGYTQEKTLSNKDKETKQENQEQPTLGILSKSSGDEDMEVTEEDSKDVDHKKSSNEAEAMETDSEENKKKENISPIDVHSDQKEYCPSAGRQEDKCKTQVLLPRIHEGGGRRSEDIWDDICGALGSIHCLRGVTLPTCRAEVLQLLLTRCRHLVSVTATDLREPSGISKFDPAYLMEVPQLEELRLGSPQSFSLTSNFNFIKLQQLKILVMRGFCGLSWPYLGTNLTSLQVGPISNFTNLTWNNIGSMTNLKALWLEDGGSLSDVAIYEALSRLTNLKRLCLFNFVVGPKLGQALKKISKLERVFVLPHSSSQQANIAVQNGNLLAIAETMRHVDELVWAVRSQDIQVINQVEHVQMCPIKTKDYPGGIKSENEAQANMWTLQRLEAVVKRYLPRTKVRILKLDAAAASRMALSTL